MDRTCFYPSGGGQASDRGTITIDGIDHTVVDVTKDDDEIIHMLDPMPDGLEMGIEITGTIDWNRRITLMKGHTAQHLVSAAILAEFGVSTGEVSIQPEEVGLTLQGSITIAQLELAIANVNRLTARSVAVQSVVLSRDEAIAEYSGSIRGEISPEDPVRIVNIHDVDTMCCAGTHVKDTAEIGPVFVTKFRGGKDIRFLVGDPSIEALAKGNATLLAASADLNKNIFQVAEEIERLQKGKDLLDQQVDDLSIELLEGEATKPGRVIQGVSFHCLKGITNKKLITSRFNQFPEDSVLIVMGALLDLQILSNCAIKANELVQSLTARFGGKGGGNPKVAQGILESDPGEILDAIESET